jgi:pSer/pThr/pTyr-binding forkhead associated (FHA) protein
MGAVTLSCKDEEVIMRAQGGGTPHLVVLTPDADRGRRIPVNKDNLVVGRGQTCDVRFDDPRVSRAHAVLRRRGNAVYIEDLGSSAGTFVNGVTAGTVSELHTGDLLTFASVTARLESGCFGSDATITIAARPARGGSAHYVNEQRAQVSHYDERRYNAHVQHVNQQRENFLREVAATKTKARWLVWLGFVMFVVGFGPSVGGIPIGLIGWTLAATGMLLLVFGIVLHVVATSRRKQSYREFPVLSPWQGPSS